MATIIKPKFLRARENIPPRQYSTINTRVKEPPPVPDGRAATDTAPPMQTASIIQADGEMGANEAGYTTKRIYAKQWDIEAIRRDLAAITFPDGQVKMGEGETLINPPLFADAHLQTIEANNGNPTFIMYYIRLVEFIEFCKHQTFSNGIN